MNNNYNNKITFIYESFQRSKYKIGMISNKDKTNKLTIMLYSFSKIDDYLGSNFSQIASYVFHKFIDNVDPNEINWIQKYKGYNGFKDSYFIFTSLKRFVYKSYFIIIIIIHKHSLFDVKI